MLDWLTSTVSALGAWLADHPAGMAWLMGWIMALSVSQTIKALLIPAAWPDDRVKRSTQAIAIVVGFAVAWALWPDGPHRVLMSFIVGMSAPTAYTFFKACIEARFPDLAHALSWQGVQERRGDDPPHNCEG